MNLGFAVSLVSEWELAGVVDAVVSPGSRSSPLSTALAKAATIRLHIVLDERSAGFVALGLSRASGKPTIVVTTSGTAAANLRPAVTEAFHSGVPLIVVTADRPLELHKVGASQTMEQEELFSDVVRFRVSPSVPDEVNRRTWRALASRSFHEARSNPTGMGPVHLNLAFREPLIEPDAIPLPPRRSLQPWYKVFLPGNEDIFRELGGCKHILVIAGGFDSRLSSDAEDALVRAGWPVLADPLSGLRNAASGSIANFESYLRSISIRSMVLPEALVLLGSDMASRTVNEFVGWSAENGARVVRASPRWFWQDPLSAVSDFYFGPLDAFVEKLPVAVDGSYQKVFQMLDGVAGQAIRLELGGELSEPAVAGMLYEAAGGGDVVFVSSSMPIRDIEWFAQPRVDPPSVHSNRGVNGIDGVLSTFLGVMRSAATSDAKSKGYLLIGDLALRHDFGAMGLLAGESTDLFILVVDNSGGGIFSFLPQAGAMTEDLFERVMATPQNGDLNAMVAAYGIYTQVVSDMESLGKELEEFASLGGRRIVIVKTVRSDNAALHRRVLEAGMRAAEEAVI